MTNTSADATARETLEGWIPSLASEADVRSALNLAFDYRGDVTLTLRDGRAIVGYVYDRNGDQPSLSQCTARLLETQSGSRLSIPYDQIARLEFSGRDTAAGKSFENWLKKYQEKKAAGQSASIESDPLD
ncbi:MAG: hypothetical protein KF859_11260 [Phycisphaeraceae bacterium]|nr:hypothetical protein [Phycisphaeraceae bacterium]